MKVTFNRLAMDELITAARQLDLKIKLGHALLDEYGAWEIQVKRFPNSCPEIAPGIRSGYLKRFKYHVTYRVCTDAIRILYVRYARRAPLKHWSRI